MYIKVTQSGPRRYVQLVESFRDANGRPKQRTLASLGRLEKLTDNIDSVISGLRRISGQSDDSPASDLDASEPAIVFDPARAIGDVWTLSSLWKELGFSRLRTLFRRGRSQIDMEALVRIMVFNRLCDPQSKLGVLRWLETVSLPDMELQLVEHQHLLRAMDALIDQHEEVEKVVSSLLRPLVDQELTCVFYDMTTIRAEGLSTHSDDLRQYGMAKEGLIKRQFMLGLVQTADGLPLYHEVFTGNTAEVQTLQPTLKKIIARFPVKRIVVVADRGLLSTENLQELENLTLPDEQPLEYILAVPGRRYSEFVDLLAPFHDQHGAAAQKEVVGELSWADRRLVVAHNPVNATEMSLRRDSVINELESQARQWVGKLDAQDEGKKSRGRKLSDGGARAKFYRAVCEARLSQIIKVDLKSELFRYEIDEKALTHARLMDGKLLLVTNTRELSPEQVVDRYKALADIERGFRVLKSEIEIGPVHHRLPERIRAHASICFMALVLYRVMRQRLRAADAGISPERALSQLRRIQHHNIELNKQSLSGISTMSPEQRELLKSLKVEKPTDKRQLSLL